MMVIVIPMTNVRPALQEDIAKTMYFNKQQHFMVQQACVRRCADEDSSTRMIYRFASLATVAVCASTAGYCL
jgi:hypothetical protein